MTDAIEILRKKGLKIGTALAKNSGEVMGVDDPVRLKVAEKYLHPEKYLLVVVGNKSAMSPLPGALPSQKKEEKKDEKKRSHN